MKKSTVGLLVVLGLVVLGGGALLMINSVNADTEKVTNGMANSIKMSNGNACYCANALDPYGKTIPCLQVDAKSGKEIKNAMGCSCTKKSVRGGIGRFAYKPTTTCSVNTEEAQKTILVGKVTREYRKVNGGFRGSYNVFHISVADANSKTGKSDIAVQSREGSTTATATCLVKGQASNMESYMSSLIGTMKTIDATKLASILSVGNEVMVSGTIYYTDRNGERTVNYMIADVIKFAEPSPTDSTQAAKTAVPQESQTKTAVTEEVTATASQTETPVVVGQ